MSHTPLRKKENKNADTALKSCLILCAGIWLASGSAWAGDALLPGQTVDRNSGVVADPDWIPCARDPLRGRMKHCSEEYRLCREAGKTSVVCLAERHPTLTPATRPSRDEYSACRSAGHSEARCAEILDVPAK